MSWRKFLLIPELAYYGLVAKRDRSAAWDVYWASIHETGSRGEVLWDPANEQELGWVVDTASAHCDRALPLVDLGCGNGRYARALAPRFSRVMGVDVSARAVEKAREESAGMPNVSYRALDMTGSGAGVGLAAELGEVNVFSRGLFHILDHPARVAIIDNVRDMLGQRGALFFFDTDFDGGSLDYLESVGARPGAIPSPILLCAKAGLKPPTHFGEEQHHRYFPADRWRTLASGHVGIHVLPVGVDQKVEFPGYYAVVRPADQSLSL